MIGMNLEHEIENYFDFNKKKVEMVSQVKLLLS